MCWLIPLHGTCFLQLSLETGPPIGLSFSRPLGEDAVQYQLAPMESQTNPGTVTSRSPSLPSIQLKLNEERSLQVHVHHLAESHPIRADATRCSTASV